jgi:hypothetical protein
VLGDDQRARRSWVRRSRCGVPVEQEPSWPSRSVIAGTTSTSAWVSARCSCLSTAQRERVFGVRNAHLAATQRLASTSGNTREGLGTRVPGTVGLSAEIGMALLRRVPAAAPSSYAAPVPRSAQCRRAIDPEHASAAPARWRSTAAISRPASPSGRTRVRVRPPEDEANCRQQLARRRHLSPNHLV